MRLCDLPRAFTRLADHLSQSRPLVYVNCGARGDTAQPMVDTLPHARLIGFEPDQDEATALRQNAKSGYEYFPVAAGKQTETRRLHITRNRACTSLLEPNVGFMGKFLDCAQQMEVLQTSEVETVSLDTFLHTVDVSYVDFIDLDTQGSELEILHGAESLLSSSLLGIQIEVEFSPIYLEQPLFSHVDSHLREFGFMLFDLSRYHYRRQDYPRDLNTRGQLLYGKAIYLKDYNQLAEEERKSSAAKLCMIAAFHGFHDYALEIIDFLAQGGAGELEPDEIGAIAEARREYMASLARRSKLERGVRWLSNSRLGGLIRRGAALCQRLTQIYLSATERANFNWSD